MRLRSMRSLLIVLVLAALLPVLLVQASLYWGWFQSRHRQELQANYDMANAVAGAFETYVRGLGRREMAVGQALTRLEPITIEQTTDFLRDIQADYPMLSSMQWVSAGKVIASSDAAWLGADIAGQEYYRAAIQQHEPVLSDLLESPLDGRPIIVVAVAVYSPQNEVRGVVTATINADDFRPSIPRVVSSPSGSTTLFDRLGQLVYRHPFQPLTWQQRRAYGASDKALQAALAGHEGSGTHISPIDALERLVARVPIGQTGWVAGAGRPQSEVFAPVISSMLPSAILSLLALAATVVLAMVISWRITHGLEDLRRRTVALSQGRLEPRAVTSTIPELNSLATAYNHMAAARISAENALRESQTFLKGIIENAPAAVYVKDLLGHWTLVNRRMEELFGRPRQELEGKTDHDLMPAVAADRVRANDQVVLSTRQPQQFEELITTIAGERMFVTVKFPLLDERGEPYAVCGISTDITDRKQMEEALRLGEERLKVAAESAEVGMWHWDIINDQLLWDEQVYRHHYVQPDVTPTYRLLLQTIHPDDRQRVDGLVQESIQQQTPYRNEFRVIDPQGQVHWIASRGRVFYDDHGQPLRMHGVCFDITDRKQAQEALERTAAELARSNQDLEQFAYIASHDLQEPLRMIGGYVQLLQRHYADALDDKAKQYIEYAVDGAARMGNLINDLLQYSRLGTRTKPFAPTDMQRLLENVLLGLRVSLRESGAVITHEVLPTIQADDTQMAQLLQNLLSNAIKFRGDQPPQIHVGAKRGKNEWVFSVSDNGIGIDPQFHDRIFLIFQRLHTRKAYSGTGIGLAICKKIVDRHGGRIWIRSKPGEGSTFYFTIPD